MLDADKKHTVSNFIQLVRMQYAGYSADLISNFIASLKEALTGKPFPTI